VRQPRRAPRRQLLFVLDDEEKILEHGDERFAEKKFRGKTDDTEDDDQKNQKKKQPAEFRFHLDHLLELGSREGESQG
jgi:hypothetical protein